MRKMIRARSSLSFWQTSRKLSLTQPHSFNYKVYRDIAKEAYAAARKAINLPLAEVNATHIITPYGFEVFLAPFLKNPNITALKKSWPEDTNRLYPALSIPKNMDRNEAENFACLFAALFKIIAREQYRELHDRLAYLGVHRNGRYSHLTAENFTTQGLMQVKTMHIELFKTDDILEHYANYMVCLFGAIIKENQNLPEIRSFDEVNGSKTGRNRLFQLFTMCHALAKALMEVPEFTPEQQELYRLIFLELRIQNPSELIEEIPTLALPISSQEFLIRDNLIFPYLELMRVQLAEMPGPYATYRSEAYYDGKNPLEALVPIQFAEEIKRLVKLSYLKFPELVEEQNSKFASPARR